MIRVNVFNAAMRPISDKCISFMEEKEVIKEAAMKMIASIYINSAPYNKNLSMTEPNHETIYNNVVYLFVNLGECAKLDVCATT